MGGGPRGSIRTFGGQGGAKGVQGESGGPSRYPRRSKQVLEVSKGLREV